MNRKLKSIVIILLLAPLCVAGVQDGTDVALHFPLLPKILLVLLIITLLISILLKMSRLEKAEKYKRDLENTLKNRDKQIEELKNELMNVHSKLKLSHKLVGLGFWEFDVPTNEFHISSEIYSLLGLSPEAYSGNSDELLPFIPEEIQSQIIEEFEKSRIEQRQGNITHKVINPKEETSKYIQQSWEHIYSETGEHLKTMGTVLDITDHYLIETENLKIQRQLRTIIDSINAMVYFKDREGRYQLVNNSFVILSGKKEKALIGKTAEEIFPPQTAKKLTQREVMLYKKGFVANYEESHNINRRSHTYSTTKVPLFDSAGVIYGLVGMSIDITHQKKMENDLRQAKEKAEEASRSKSEFLANMSHEIRTPLNAVTGYCELLQNIVVSDREKGYIRGIKTAGKTLLTLINDILDLSKLEAGKLQLNRKPTALMQLFNELEQIFHLKAQEKGLQLTFFISNSFPNTILIDHERLKQVLLNLIGNALKFTDKGSIILSAEADFSDDRCIISVKDTGIGIKEDALETIFADFEQQSGQDSRKYGGTGLGLSICKRLITLMGGEIFVSSKHGEGTTFVVSLPLEIVHQEVEYKEIAESIPKLTFQNQNVWIIDDSESNRVLLEEAIKLVNLRYESFSSGEECIAQLAKKSPDLVITDMKMPGVSGIDILHIVKDKDRSIPVIVITTLDSVDEYQFFTNKGFDQCLQKPIEIENLYDTLTRYLALQAKPDTPKKEPKEECTIPDSVLTFLEKVFLKKVEALKGAIKLEVIKQLITELQEKTEDVECPNMHAFMDNLKASVEAFDVMAIRSIPETTRTLIEKFKRS